MNRFGIVALFVVAVFGGCQTMHHESAEQGDREDHEVKVAFDQLPEPVRATLTREAEGTPIASVDEEQQEGSAVYEADAIIGGTNYEIRVDSAGKLLSKKIDNEADEHGQQEAGNKGEQEDKD